MAISANEIKAYPRGKWTIEVHGSAKILMIGDVVMKANYKRYCGGPCFIENEEIQLIIGAFSSAVIHYNQVSDNSKCYLCNCGGDDDLLLLFMLLLL